MGEPEPIKPIPISKLRHGTKKANEQTIKIATWNIKRGLLKRELEIIELIESEKIDLLFLTETDIVLESESEYKIKGFYTFFPARENNTDQIRIIALLRTSLDENIKIKNEIISRNFPQFGLNNPRQIKLILILQDSIDNGPINATMTNIKLEFLVKFTR